MMPENWCSLLSSVRLSQVIWGIHLQCEGLGGAVDVSTEAPPLIRVINSSCLIFMACRSIFRASSMVKVVLSLSYRPRPAYLNTSNVMYSMMFWIRFCVIGDLADLSIEMSKRDKNCLSEVWYMTLTRLISVIKKYKMEPRVATGRNSSRAVLILISVSAAISSFWVTST